MMKALLLFTLFWLSTGNPFVPRKNAVVGRQDDIRPEHRYAESEVWTIVPRGGATVLGITPDVAAKIIIFTGLTHIPNFIDPNVAPRSLIHRNLENDYQVYALQSGSIAFVNIAVLTYLASSTQTSVTDMIKLANLAQISFFASYILRGRFKKLAFLKGSGESLLLFWILCQLALWFNVGDSQLIAKLILIPYIVQGVTGYFTPVFNVKLWTNSDISTNPTSIYFTKWFSVVVGTMALIPITLIRGGSWRDALGYTSLEFAWLYVDFVFLSQLAGKVGVAPWFSAFVIGLFGLMGYNLLTP